MKKPSDAKVRRLRVRAHDLSKNDAPETTSAIFKLLKLLKQGLFLKKGD